MRNREPRFKEIVHYVEDRIRCGELTIGDKVPSVNAMRILFGFSRSTVFLAMEELTSRGIIEARPGSGYYVSSTRVEVREKVLLLFNEFNAFKEDLYNSFVQEMGEDASIDIMFHNYNRHVFETLLENANGKYTSYVVMPGKFEGLAPLLDSMSGDVILVDHFSHYLAGRYPSVGQNFAKDTYNALSENAASLKKYDTLVLVQQAEKEPAERYDGLCRFCRDYGLQPHWWPSMKGEKVRAGELYLTAEDRELVLILKKAEAQGLVVGRDFGVISYNDTPMKEILCGGITTISTDFKRMGRTLARLVKEKRMETIANPCTIAIRKSI